MTPIRRILLLAVAFRLIAARTNIGWGHPDEWFQTVEFGNFIAHGFASQTTEFLIHMRNLTWPSMIAGALELAHRIDPSSVALRVYAVKLLTAALDLTAIWAFSKVLDREIRESGASERWRIGAWVLFVLPWFTIGESVRASQEHLSAIAFWWALGLLACPANRKLPAYLAGVALMLTGAFRYPSFVFTVGACLGLVYASMRPGSRAETWPKAPWIALGVLSGAVIGGLADWIFYGRPWESLWMYTQYNVFTGLSATGFGTQPWTVYLEYFKGTLGGALAPLGIATLLLAPIAIASGLRKGETWAWGLATYLAAHCLIGHKEPRFMAPALMPLLWATWKGALAACVQLAPVARARWTEPELRRASRAFRVLVAILLVANAALILRSLWGETWKVNSNFLQAGALAAERPSTCAVISIRRPVMGMLPWKSPGSAPDPAFAFMPTSRDQSPLANRAEIPLIWVGKRPECPAGATVLVQPRKPEPGWENELGCTLLATGPLALFSGGLRETFVSRGWVSAPWYECPSRAIESFPRQETRTFIARLMRKLPSLPPLGVTGEEFLKQAWGELDPRDPATRDGTFGDW